MARLLPPESAAPEIVSREVGSTVQTLERWRSDAFLQPARERIWTAAARLEAVIATAALRAFKFFQMPLNNPSNWRSPVDYSRGMIYLRVQIVSN